MKRGRLRVLLGAAPGVGKTYQMLVEGRQLRDEGADVVIALVEFHGRRATEERAEGLERVAMRSVSHRGAEFHEIDVAAVIARAPDLALVDELAHTNVPIERAEKRWHDVEKLRDAGIDVITTVNIQHIESLRDIVEQITKVPQRESVPDAVLRSADEVELVDLPPQVLRDRLSRGLVYPAERVDAALSNYFRVGNLTALRELALLWLAGEVDTALNEYRETHGIEARWDARERVVVALTGGPESETLIRRGARIASRTAGGELLAVHVVGNDGVRGVGAHELAQQRALIEELGGSYHQVVGDRVAESLVEFARGVNATQLVIGVSRRSRVQSLLTGSGIGATVVREAGDLDVHIVTHTEAGHRGVLPKLDLALSRARQIGGFAIALTVGPLLTWFLLAVRTDESIISDVLVYQSLVIVVALVGGMWPAIFAAVMSGVTLDFFFIEPQFTIKIESALQGFALVLFVVNAILVSIVVDRAARRSRIAQRATAEAETLALIAGSVIRGEDALTAIAERTREAFGLTAVRVLSGEDVVAQAGDVDGAGWPSESHAGAKVTVQLYGGTVSVTELRILRVIIAQIDTATERAALEATAQRVQPLEAADKVRSALLSAVSHDLRRPLTAARTAVGTLKARDISLSETDRDELLETADDSLRSLTNLVTDLLDVSRLQAGVLGISLTPISSGDAILPALDELGLGPGQIEIDIASETANFIADPPLLTRAVVNLLTNALRFSEPDAPPRVTASGFDGRVEIRVIDHGPGVSADRLDEIFVPFQRLGDTDNLTGLGLGLALSKGFVEGMGGTITAEQTPGGGLTMVISLTAAPGAADAVPTPATAATDSSSPDPAASIRGEASRTRTQHQRNDA